MPPLLVTHSADEHAAHACGRLALALRLLLIVGIVGGSRRSGRCIRPGGLPHPVGHRKLRPTSSRTCSLPCLGDSSIRLEPCASVGILPTTRRAEKTSPPPRSQLWPLMIKQRLRRGYRTVREWRSHRTAVVGAATQTWFALQPSVKRGVPRTEGTDAECSTKVPRYTCCPGPRPV
jgi:hypothetical protein